MSLAHGKLDRLEAWFDFQNALHDQKMKGRPAWWHAGKIAFGVLMLAKAFGLALNASALGGYAMALVLFVCGLGLSLEGSRLLLELWLLRQS